MFFKLKILYFFIGLKIQRALGLLKLDTYLKIKKVFLMKRLKMSKFYNNYNLSLDNFKNLPIINKEIFMNNFNDINTVNISYNQAIDVAKKAESTRNFNPMIGDISVGLSTGTSGNRGLFLLNEKERARWVALILDRVIGFSFKPKKVAFFLRANNKLYESTNSKILNFNFFDIYKKIDSHFTRLSSLQPDILIAQPSVLMIIAKAIENNDLKIKPTKVISVAEVLTKEDRLYFESVFKIRLSEVYQCTEGFLATTCKKGVLHFNEDFLIVEKKFINHEKTKFHPIITDLLRTTQPVIRYELNDIVSIKENCKCGSKFMAIDKVEGRSDDIISLLDDNKKIVKIFPDIFRRTIVLSDDRIKDYSMIQKTENTLELYIDSKFSNSFLSVKKSIEKMLKKYNISQVDILKVNKLQFTVGDKKRRIKNEYS